MFTNSIRCHTAVTIAVHTTSRIFNIEVQNFRKNYNKVAHIAKKHYLCTTKSAFIRSALEQKTGKRLRLWDFKKKLAETMELLHMDASYAERDLNVGFSGGEKKKAEILQMLMLEPKLAILDETDSGLDVDAVRTVSQGVQLYRERVHGSLLIITHSTRILEALTVDETHVMENGVIVRNGGAGCSVRS